MEAKEKLVLSLKTSHFRKILSIRSIIFKIFSNWGVTDTKRLGTPGLLHVATSTKTLVHHFKHFCRVVHLPIGAALHGLCPTASEDTIMLESAILVDGATQNSIFDIYVSILWRHFRDMQRMELALGPMSYNFPVLEAFKLDSFNAGRKLHSCSRWTVSVQFYL